MDRFGVELAACRGMRIALRMGFCMRCSLSTWLCCVDYFRLVRWGTTALTKADAASDEALKRGRRAGAACARIVRAAAS